jgi:hypothetical protein
VFGRSSGPQDRTQPAKLEITFGHAFDKRGYRCLEALRAPAARPSFISRFGVFPGASDRKPRKKNSRTARHPVGVPARLAQIVLCDRDNHVRKSRSQSTDPDTGHSRDDRGRDDGAHRDADTPKAIGITLIDTVRDQHHSQP